MVQPCIFHHNGKPMEVLGYIKMQNHAPMSKSETQSVKHIQPNQSKEAFFVQFFSTHNGWDLQCIYDQLSVTHLYFKPSSQWLICKNCSNAGPCISLTEMNWYLLENSWCGKVTWVLYFECTKKSFIYIAPSTQKGSQITSQTLFITEPISLTSERQTQENRSCSDATV